MIVRPVFDKAALPINLLHFIGFALACPRKTPSLPLLQGTAPFRAMHRTRPGPWAEKWPGSGSVQGCGASRRTARAGMHLDRFARPNAKHGGCWPGFFQGPAPLPSRRVKSFALPCPSLYCWRDGDGPRWAVGKEVFMPPVTRDSELDRFKVEIDLRAYAESEHHYRYDR